MSDYTGILGQFGAAPGRFVLGRIPHNVATSSGFIYRPHRGFDSAFQYDQEPQKATMVAPAKDNTPAWQLPQKVTECR
jgi:hypothetical protein